MSGPGRKRAGLGTSLLGDLRRPDEDKTPDQPSEAPEEPQDPAQAPPFPPPNPQAPTVPVVASTPEPAPSRPRQRPARAQPPSALAAAAEDPDEYLKDVGLAGASDKRTGLVALNVAVPVEVAEALDRYNASSRLRTRRVLITALIHGYAADAGLLAPPAE